MIDIADASVDTVISTHVLCSVPDADKVLGEIKRVLKPGMMQSHRHCMIRMARECISHVHAFT